MSESQGERGRTGATGATGEAGETGGAGPVGETGEAGQAGRRGEAGHAGLPGPAGEIGVPGRQGEAGVSGRQGEAGAQGRQGQPGVSTRGEAGATGARGRRGVSFSNTQVTAVFLFVVVAFAVLSLRTELQQRQINRNAHLIVVTQYDQCQARNAATSRQNALIDSAIEAEKRKPHPDPKRVADLTNFKGATPACGPKP